MCVFIDLNISFLFGSFITFDLSFALTRFMFSWLIVMNLNVKYSTHFSQNKKEELPFLLGLNWPWHNVLRNFILHPIPSSICTLFVRFHWYFSSCLHSNCNNIQNDRHFVDLIWILECRFELWKHQHYSRVRKKRWFLIIGLDLILSVRLSIEISFVVANGAKKRWTNNLWQKTLQSENGWEDENVISRFAFSAAKTMFIPFAELSPN